MATPFILYKYKHVMIKIDRRILFTEIRQKLLDTLENVLLSIPYKIYKESLANIVIGENSVIPSQNSSIFYKNTIYISPYFLQTQSPFLTLQKILVHELGHTFVEGWKDNLFVDNTILDDFVSLKEKIKKVIPSFPTHLVYAKKFNSKYRNEIEKFIRDFGEGALFAELHPIIRSPYMLLSVNEFIAYSFEEFFLGEEKKVKMNSPKLYKMIKKTLQ